jgi:hypothetical protein
MKKLLTIALLATGLISGMRATAQEKGEDKSKRPSPPAKVSQKINSGATITIDYSQPSLNGRTIGKDVEPMDGKVWRTGANEATTFETDKELNVLGSKLPVGKYGLFTIFNGDAVTVIFNKTWNQWGAFKYNDSVDVLRVNTRVTTVPQSTAKMTFKIDKTGLITLLWGTKKVEFKVT